MTSRMTPFSGRKILEICNFWWITPVSVLWENFLPFSNFLEFSLGFVATNNNKTGKQKKTSEKEKKESKHKGDFEQLSVGRGTGLDVVVHVSRGMLSVATTNWYTLPIKVHKYNKLISDVMRLLVWFSHWEPDVMTGFKSENREMNIN